MVVGGAGSYTRALEHSNIEMINLRLPAENKKVLAVQSCSQATEQTEEEKDGWKEEGNWRSCSFAFHPLAPTHLLPFYPCSRALCHALNICLTSSNLPLLSSLCSIPSKVCYPPLSFSPSSSPSPRLFCLVQLFFLHLPPLLQHHTFHAPPAPPPSFPTPVPPPPSLHGEHQEAREGGVFPSSHEISSLQFKVCPVSLLHLDQNTIAGCLTRHILVTGKGRNHRPAIVHQAHLERAEKGSLYNEKRIVFCFVYCLFFKSHAVVRVQSSQRDFF